MKHKKGYSLVELIIAVVLIGICILPVALVFQTVLAKNYRLTVITTAVSLAEDKMDEVLIQGYTIGGGVGVVYSESFASPFDDYSYAVEVHNVEPPNLGTSVDPTDTGYKNVEVRVAHAQAGTYKLVSMVTNWE